MAGTQDDNAGLVDAGTPMAQQDAGPPINYDDIDNDGIPNEQDDDDDNDGLTDIEELKLWPIDCSNSVSHTKRIPTKTGSQTRTTPTLTTHGQSLWYAERPTVVLNFF